MVFSNGFPMAFQSFDVFWDSVWRAYSLSGQERGDDGLPKAFTRHSEKKDIYRKPRKGNRRGGVHKTGGLHLGGWTEEDSNKEYKKKVEDRRER